MHPKDKNAYVGRSGHLVVMSELVALGYRVTIPEVDVGKDILAFLDTQAGVTTVQVKSTDCQRRKAPGKFSGQIELSLTQLLFGGDFYFIFAFGLDDDWVEYIVISRETLNDLRGNESIGTERTRKNKKYLKLTFSFSDTGVMCGAVDFNNYRNAWKNLPQLKRPETAEVVPGVVAGQAVYLAPQTAVVSRLLRMGCNVALAEVDKLLAFQDEEPGITPIRVKAGSGIAAAEPGSYTAQVEVRLAELKFRSDLYYIFPLNWNGRWVDFIIISRARLNDLRFNRDVCAEYRDGNTGQEFLKLTFSLSKQNVTCDGVELDDCRNAWKSLPPLVRASVADLPRDGRQG